jgi:hypothetical protein
MSNKVFALH